MGASGCTFPYSFGSRGFPKIHSPEFPETFAGRDRVLISHASHLTIHEIQAKRAELMITPDEGALEVLPLLNDLLTHLHMVGRDPKHQRIIFWFD